MARKLRFEWDDLKNLDNRRKHDVSFQEAQLAFFDPHRIIAKDKAHSIFEVRYYCFGKIKNKILTVRFTLRGDLIRIYGAGYWRKGNKAYEEKNKKN